MFTSVAILALVSFIGVSASPTAFKQPTVCAAGQMAVGHQTDQYSGLYGVIFDSNCAQMDFKSAFDSSLCGGFAFGSQVTCEGLTVSAAKVAIEGDVFSTFGSCTPAPKQSNCNNTFGLTLNTTLLWCCS